MKRSISILSAILLSVVVSVTVAAAEPPAEGSGFVDFALSLNPAIGPNGEAGRLVVLSGTISGENFEPGLCNPDPNFFGKCANFTDEIPVPVGGFNREHAGAAAFTICDPCTIDGRIGSFILKISYPNPRNPAFTKFTIQDAAGGLAGLRGQGTLELTGFSYTLNYQFVE